MHSKTKVVDQQALLEKAKQGDPAACDQIARTHIPLAYRYFRKAWNVSQAEAEELTQETFVEVWSSLSRCQGDTLKPWLMTIARRVAWKTLSPKPSVRFMEEFEEELVIEQQAMEPNQEELVVMKNQWDFLRQAFDTLRGEFREVLYLHYLEEFSTEEIAQTLELPLGTVKTWLQRARAQLQKQLHRIERAL